MHYTLSQAFEGLIISETLALCFNLPQAQADETGGAAEAVHVSLCTHPLPTRVLQTQAQGAGRAAEAER